MHRVSVSHVSGTTDKIVSSRVSGTAVTPELLAPAGGIEQLRYALHFGADSVYLAGERFGLRTRADNFTHEQLQKALALTHEAGKRLFVTVNALMHNQDMGPLAEYLQELERFGADAVIVSDLAAIRLVQEHAPHVAVHISTQASCANYGAAQMYYEMGAKRVVLARELSLEEIRYIRQQVPDDLELEVFVHGAMCMAHSGRCLISNYLVNRDANRGHCTQPCRWNYALVEETRPGVYFPVEEGGGGTFLMNSKDLMMLDHLDDLILAGVDSLKIEGRVKGAYYVATVVNAYRQVLDGAPADVFLSELERVSHRPYHTGFFYGEADQTFGDDDYLQTHDLIATVLSCEPCGPDRYRVTVQQRNRFFEGDVLEVLTPSRPVRTVTVCSLCNEDGVAEQMCNRAMAHYTFESDIDLKVMDILRKEREDERVKG